ncbi:MAG: hypothetical protein HFJ09_09445 [Lachnospiraceae bacterium]|nr:hypothetical protein [Lachnospiraceae bacterium]
MGKVIKLADIRKALDEVEKNRGNVFPISDKSIDVILEVLSVAELELTKSK